VVGNGSGRLLSDAAVGLLRADRTLCLTNVDHAHAADILAIFEPIKGAVPLELALDDQGTWMVLLGTRDEASRALKTVRAWVRGGCAWVGGCVRACMLLCGRASSACTKQNDASELPVGSTKGFVGKRDRCLPACVCNCARVLVRLNPPS
jgi:hypothetical protein